MLISVPVTDYIPASILTTLNDVVVRGAAIPERQPGLLRAIGTHIGNDTRNAGGAQVITGVGFEPSVVIFIACDNIGSLNRSWGYGKISDNMCLYDRALAVWNGLDTTKCIVMMIDGANLLNAVVTATGADGFTLTWTLTGVATANFTYLCLP